MRGIIAAIAVLASAQCAAEIDWKKVFRTLAPCAVSIGASQAIMGGESALKAGVAGCMVVGAYQSFDTRAEDQAELTKAQMRQEMEDIFARMDAKFEESLAEHKDTMERYKSAVGRALAKQLVKMDKSIDDKVWKTVSKKRFKKMVEATAYATIRKNSDALDKKQGERLKKTVDDIVERVSELVMERIVGMRSDMASQEIKRLRTENETLKNQSSGGLN